MAPFWGFRDTDSKDTYMIYYYPWWTHRLISLKRSAPQGSRKRSHLEFKFIIWVIRVVEVWLPLAVAALIDLDKRRFSLTSSMPCIIFPFEIEEQILHLLDKGHSALKTFSLLSAKHFFLTYMQETYLWSITLVGSTHAFERLLRETPEIADYIRKLDYSFQTEGTEGLTSPSIQEALKRISRREFFQSSIIIGRNSTGATTQSALHCFTSYIFLPSFSFRWSPSTTRRHIGSYTLRQPPVLEYRFLYDYGSWKYFPCSFA